MKSDREFPVGLFFMRQGEIQAKEWSDLSFKYKEQYAVIVLCKDEAEQESIYDRLKAEGYQLKVVSVWR